jgi:hypothetical protein
MLFSPPTPESQKMTFAVIGPILGEKLGFLGRVIHGSNARTWAKELRARIGETADFTAAVG